MLLQASFNNLVDAGGQYGWNAEAERLCCLQVDYELPDQQALRGFETSLQHRG
jgi:hypothetical protein